MRRLFIRTLLFLATAGITVSARAFSLLGPIDAVYQTAGIGYNPLGTDQGGPMNLGEGYRWNVRTIYYGFDPSFVHYFGDGGSNAVVQALETFNKLGPMSRLSTDLREFPNNTRQINWRAATLGIVDVKSFTLAVMCEVMGLAAPERYVWTLRDRRPIPNTTPQQFQYLVIQRNFDPVTKAPSSYVNDALYYYAIADPIPLFPQGEYADAIELPVDPLRSFTSVANSGDSIYGFGIFSGSFFTGLTRDDVGGLRYLYNKSFANTYVENLVTNAIAGTGGGSVWSPAGGSTNMVVTAPRPGIDKLLFKQMRGTGFGNFIAFTNQNKDIYFPSNSVRLTSQTFQRAMVLPDIVFAAGDLPLDAGGNPFTATLNLSGAFLNNSALNSQVGSLTAGPGNVNPTVILTFNKVGPHLYNQGPDFLDQGNLAGIGFTWGSYDGTTNDPVVYPIGLTIQTLQEIIFAP